MLSVDFKKYINSFLKPYGFTREKNNWFMKKDRLLVVLSLDKNPYCDGFFVDVGAELDGEAHMKCPTAAELDIMDSFIFPADPNDLYSYKELTHCIPRRRPGSPAIAKPYIDISIFPDEAIFDTFRYNAELRFLPMLDIDSLKNLDNNDIAFIQCGKEKKLPLYGVSEEMIKKHSFHIQ